MDEESSKEYRWESGYEKTWEAITEDKDGMLDVSVQEIIQKARRKRLAERTGKTKLGMMRHLYVILDMSQSMESQDLKPTRLLCCLKLLEGFIDEYFYLNPISQLGLVTTSNKRAEKVSEMTGNPRKHIEAVKSLASKQCQGEPSLQNSVELVIQSLRNMPPHASRELIVIMGSLTTCDPSDINRTVATAKELKIRCSVINLSAEVRIYRELVAQTGGVHNVILDDLHFKDLLAQHLDPPPSTSLSESSLIRMGFPSHAGREGCGLGMCLCHLDTSVTGGESGSRISTAGYLCPQCSAKYCELPVECRGCGLTLVSAPHLARSYHHLFPLPPFQEVEPSSVPPDQTTCSACTHRFSNPVDRMVYQCPSCRKMFCTECDLFIHETLHTCPGCASLSARSAPQSNRNSIGDGHGLANGNGVASYNGVG